MVDESGNQAVGGEADGVRKDVPKARRPRGCLFTAFKVALWLLVSVTALVLLTWVGTLLYGNSKLKAAQDEAHKAGLPFSYNELQVQVWGGDGKVPDSENAALCYQKAFALLRKDADKSLPIVGDAQMPDDPRLPLPDGMLGDISGFLTSQKAAIDLLHEGAALPKCQFPLQWDGYATPLPHLAPARQSARILALKAWLDAEEGRPADAVTDMEDSLALGRSVGEEPMLISGLVAVAIDSITLYSADRLLARADVPAGDLMRLQKAFAETANSLSFRNNFAGEFVFNQDTYQRLLDGRVNVLDLEHLGNTNGESEMPAGSAGRALLRFLAVVPLRGYFKADQANAARFLMRMAKDASEPAPAVLSAGYTEQLMADASQGGYILSRMLLPALTKAQQQCEDIRAKLRGGAACIAALRYKNDTGDWPRSLEKLVPKYIDALPIDPFTGAPLAYRTSEKGVVVYSVGPNRIDDGATQLTGIRPKGMDRNDWWRSGDDVGFRIWK